MLPRVEERESGLAPSCEPGLIEPLAGIEFHAWSRRCRDRVFEERNFGRSLLRAGCFSQMVVAALQRAARILLAIIYSATW